jgi:hypothetical protein
MLPLKSQVNNPPKGFSWKHVEPMFRSFTGDTNGNWSNALCYKIKLYTQKGNKASEIK